MGQEEGWERLRKEGKVGVGARRRGCPTKKGTPLLYVVYVRDHAEET